MMFYFQFFLSKINSNVQNEILLKRDFKSLSSVFSGILKQVLCIDLLHSQLWGNSNYRFSLSMVNSQANAGEVIQLTKRCSGIDWL